MQTFESSDFYLSAYLKAEGFELMDVRREGRRAVFVFRDRPDRREAVMAFFSNKAAFRPMAFVAAIREMKALLHSF